jgi:hypothetical protein
MINTTLDPELNIASSEMLIRGKNVPSRYSFSPEKSKFLFQMWAEQAKSI